MATVLHRWVARAKCDCGFIWTNPSAQSVVCKCTASEIKGDVLVRGADLPIDEAEFTQAVADDLGVDVSDLRLEKA